MILDTSDQGCCILIVYSESWLRLALAVENEPSSVEFATFQLCTVCQALHKPCQSRPNTNQSRSANNVLTCQIAWKSLGISFSLSRLSATTRAVHAKGVWVSATAPPQASSRRCVFDTARRRTTRPIGLKHAKTCIGQAPRGMRCFATMHLRPWPNAAPNQLLGKA